ncbi:MAG: thermonuclease family protein [Singulisphaera sp.]
MIVLVAATGCSADGTGRVVGVSDGDTLTVLKDRKQVKVRLHGIDAPETGQDFGSRAKQAASDMEFGRTVTVRPHEIDRYGRTVADVILPDGRSLNRAMVGQGMAWWLSPLRSSLPGSGGARSRGQSGQARSMGPARSRAALGLEEGHGGSHHGTGRGNRRSFVYHAPHCRGAAALSDKNRVEFKTASEAEAAGYRKAGDCR